MKKIKKDVKILNQEYFDKKSSLYENQQKSILLSRKHHLKMILLFIIISIITLALGIDIVKNDMRTNVLNGKVAAAKIDLKYTKDENKQLNQKVDQLEDPSYVAKYIRSKYYFSKKGETIYSLPYDKPKSVTAN